MEGSKYWNSVGDNREYSTSNPDMLASPEPALSVSDRGLLETALNQLNKEQKWLIVNHFGIFGHQPVSYQKLGKKLWISRQAVAKRIHFSIRKLRKIIRRLET